MDHRQLGDSELSVSTLTLGSVAFTEPQNDLPNAQLILDRALDAGVNLVDTADSYPGAEEVVGKVIKGRPEVLVSSKVAFPVGPTPNDRGLSRSHIIRQAENSLRLLGRDHIDLYHLHLWDGLTPLEETVAALAELVRAGKIRHVAVSNFSAWHIMKLIAAATEIGGPKPIAQQIHYTAYSREAEFELLPLGLDQGLGTLVWSPLAGGLLSGKYRRDRPAPAGSRLASAYAEPPVPDEDRLFDVIEVVVAIAEKIGATPAQVALAWTLTRPGIASLVIGARTPEQLDDNLGSADLVLSADDIARIEQASRPVVPYPYWHQLAWTVGRFNAAERSVWSSYLG